MSATMEQRQDTSRKTESGPGFLKRWFCGLPLQIGLISLLAWFLPTLIAVTPLRNYVLNAASSRIPAGIEVGSATLSWTGPVELHDIRIPDDSGGNLLEVERIETENSLWELATDGFTRALFHVFRPKLRITMKENSTAVDSSIGQLLDRHVGTGKPFALDLENGLIIFVNEEGDVLTEITDVVLTLEMTPGDDGSEGSLELTGRIVREEEDGTLKLNADWSGANDEERTGHIVLDVTRFPADALGPMLASRLDGRKLHGEITGTAEANWQPDAEFLTGDFQLDAERLLVELISAEADNVPAPIEPIDQPLTDFVPAGADVQRWDLHDSMIRAAGQYDREADHAALSELTINSEVISLTASGDVHGIQSQPIVDLQGELTSDPEFLFAFLDDTLPQAIQINDLAIREFSASGPLAELSSMFQGKSDSPGEPAGAQDEQPLNLSANLSWSSMDLYGMHSANGLVDARLADSRLQLLPLQVLVGNGRVEMLPHIDLAATSRTCVLDEGPLVRDVEFTEDMCRTWLKYVSPLLADATGMDGRFSLHSAGGTMPLEDPHAADVAGTLQVHAGRVGPGPLAQQIIAVVEQVRSLSNGRVPFDIGGRRRRPRTWLELPEQNVNIHVAEGRVHHERMQYLAGDVTVATHGSVGFDDTLDAVLEIPLQDDWLDGNRYLASLKGQTLEIPLRGTLDQPQIDVRAVNQIMQRMATGAGTNLLQQLFDR